jgi:hypothetical protein
MLIVKTVLGLVLLYLTCGLLFGVAFVAVGAGRVDSAAGGTSFAFRLLILPGTVAFWPLLAARWVKTSSRRGNP